MLKVINQDRDDVYLVHGVYYKKHKRNGVLFGWNVYGYLFFKPLRVFLGTYDTEEDAKQICREMCILKQKDITQYVMPEPALDLEDLG